MLFILVPKFEPIPAALTKKMKRLIGALSLYRNRYIYKGIREEMKLAKFLAEHSNLLKSVKFSSFGLSVSMCLSLLYLQCRQRM